MIRTFSNVTTYIFFIASSNYINCLTSTYSFLFWDNGIKKAADKERRVN